jgi:type VI secretion system secreted protein VgrG
LHELRHAESVVAMQPGRQLGIKTPLGENVLLLTAFAGYEEMSRLFSFKLNMLSTRDSIEPSQIVGKLVTFWVLDGLDQPRYFNGMIREFSAGHWSRDFRHYTAEVVPSVWLLTQQTDCRTFVNKSVVQIIDAVLAEHGFSDFETHELKGWHPTWEYCVQYRESDFDFISRLMEQEGIFYYFRHENGRHVMALADQNAGFPWYPAREVEYSPAHRGPLGDDRITGWHHRYRFVPGSWSQTDYNFDKTPAHDEETPAALLAVNEPGLVKLPGNDKCQIFDCPGEYATLGDGRQLTRIRMEQEEVAHEVTSGTSSCRRFTLGAKFKLRGHQSEDEQRKSYVLTSVEHSAAEPSSYYTGDGHEGSAYNNSFTCIPADVTFRPERRTAKPAIHGSQTAIVVGPRGAEIWPDQHGRVQVQFYWDRRNKRTGDNCCWVRCAQTMAGKGWGSMFIPRVGQEVVVSFLEGDPDRPLVTGLVYNADQTPAYPLPEEKTKSYIKSCSSPSGDGFNEIRFEDKKGQEQIFIHTERDLDVRVKNDCRESVGGSRHLIVGKEGSGDLRELIYGGNDVDIKGNQIERIGVDHARTIGGNQDHVVKGTRKQQIEQDDHVQVFGSRFEKVDWQEYVTIGTHQIVKVGIIHRLEAGQGIFLKAADFLMLEAGERLTIKVGANFIELGPNGIAISGTAVRINCGDAPTTLSFSGDPDLPVDPLAATPIQPDPADSSAPGNVSTPWPGSAPASESPDTRQHAPSQNSDGSIDAGDPENPDCHLGGRCG